MKKLLLPILALLLVVGGAAIASEKKGPQEITIDELQGWMKNEKNLTVVDSRGGKYFDGEMIKGAVNLPADKTDAKSLAKIIPSKDAKVVFYCQNVDCPASTNAGYKALKAGYTHVFKFEGGIEEWKEKGLPTTKSKS